MADEEKQAQVEEQAKATDESKATEQETPNTEDKTKTEIAGLNRKIAELTKHIADEKKAKMTEKELAEAEKAEFEKLKADTLKSKMTFELGRQLVKEKLPEELTDIILDPPKSEDDIEPFMTKIKGLFKAHSAATLEEFRKSNARTTPDTTGSAKVMTRSDFNKLTPSDRSKFMQDGGQLKD